MDLIAELFPEIMGEAARLAAAAADGRARRTARGADRLVLREDHVGDARLVGAITREISAPEGPPSPYKARGAQLVEVLHEVGKGDILPLYSLSEVERYN